MITKRLFILSALLATFCTTSLAQSMHLDITDVDMFAEKKKSVGIEVTANIKVNGFRGQYARVEMWIESPKGKPLKRGNLANWDSEPFWPESDGWFNKEKFYLSYKAIPFDHAGDYYIRFSVIDENENERTDWMERTYHHFYLSKSDIADLNLLLVAGAFDRAFYGSE